MYFDVAENSFLSTRHKEVNRGRKKGFGHKLPGQQRWVQGSTTTKLTVTIPDKMVLGLVEQPDCQHQQHQGRAAGEPEECEDWLPGAADYDPRCDDDGDLRVLQTYTLDNCQKLYVVPKKSSAGLPQFKQEGVGGEHLSALRDREQAGQQGGGHLHRHHHNRRCPHHQQAGQQRGLPSSINHRWDQQFKSPKSSSIRSRSLRNESGN